MINDNDYFNLTPAFGMVAGKTNNAAYDQRTNLVRLGLQPCDSEKHNIRSDELSARLRSVANEIAIESINDLICDYTRICAKDHDVQEGDGHKVKLGVIDTMPELKWHVALPLPQNLLLCDPADDAAKICAHLMYKLKEIESQYLNQLAYDSYQIELRRVTRASSLCRLFLRVDASTWYNLEKGRDKLIEEKVDYHIQKVEEEYEDDGFFSSSKLRKNDYEHLEDIWSCKKKVLVHGKRQCCGFFVKKSYCIYQTNEFYAAARFDGLPVITICPIEHWQNEDWFLNNFLRTPAAWKAVLEVLRYIQGTLGLDELPFYEIYANFRKWHSQIRKGRSDDHAHINILLTRAAIDACKNTCGNLRCLSESIIRPPNYRLDDANALKEELKKELLNLSDIDKFNEEETSSN